MDAESSLPDLRSLVDAICADTASAEDLHALSTLLQESETAQEYYLEYCRMHVELYFCCGEQRLNEAVFEDIRSGAITAEPSPASAPLLSATVWHGAVTHFSSGWPLAYLIATVIFTLGMLTLAFTHVSQPEQVAQTHSAPASSFTEPPAASVGQVTAMADCQLANGCGALLVNDAVPVGREVRLESGLMEITYDSGAKVILQGPVTYVVESGSGGYLAVGKLTARVENRKGRSEGAGGGLTEERSELGVHGSPDSRLPTPSLRRSFSGSLFSVRTPTATVTDLGTEFGVEVDKQGGTTSHVFRGAVNVQLRATDGTKEVGGIVLHENESARTEKGRNANGLAVVIHRVRIDPQAFVRQLVRPPRTIDLLDIVAGGNGTGHHRERGIDPASGMEDPIYLLESRKGTQSYLPVSWHKLIDGVFVPDGGAGPVQLDSAGHTFRFPRTTGVAWASIWSRAAEVKLWPNDERTNDIRCWIYAMDRGEQYMPDKRGLLDMHPNKGITFSLEPIRKLYPGVRPVRFRATAGMASPKGLADLWVFVDGQLKLKRMQLRQQDGVIRVDVAIGPTDRFLTIASTDGGNGDDFDWVVFGDPVLEMEPEGENK